MNNHKKYIDIVKGCAIIAVVVFHTKYKFSEITLNGGG